MRLLLKSLHTNRLQDVLLEVLVLLHISAACLGAKVSNPDLGSLNLEVVLRLEHCTDVAIDRWYTIDLDWVEGSVDTDN